MGNKAKNRERNRERISLSPRMQPTKIRPWRYKTVKHPPRQRIPAPNLRFRPKPTHQHYRQQPLVIRWLHWRSLAILKIGPIWPNQQLSSTRSSSPCQQTDPKMGCIFFWRRFARIAYREIPGTFSYNFYFNGNSWHCEMGEKRVRTGKSTVWNGWPGFASGSSCQKRGVSGFSCCACLYWNRTWCSSQDENCVWKSWQDWNIEKTENEKNLNFFGKLSCFDLAFRISVLNL